MATLKRLCSTPGGKGKQGSTNENLGEYTVSSSERLAPEAHVPAPARQSGVQPEGFRALPAKSTLHSWSPLRTTEITGPRGGDSEEAGSLLKTELH